MIDYLKTAINKTPATSASEKEIERLRANCHDLKRAVELVVLEMSKKEGAIDG